MLSADDKKFQLNENKLSVAILTAACGTRAPCSVLFLKIMQSLRVSALIRLASGCIYKLRFYVEYPDNILDLVNLCLLGLSNTEKYSEMNLLTYSAWDGDMRRGRGAVM